MTTLSIQSTSQQSIQLIMNFDDKELEFFRECISDQIEATMRGDWDAVKEDICFLHILMGKVMTLIINNDTETND